MSYIKESKENPFTLPANFRELCASLDNDQYIDMLKEITTHKFQFGDNDNLNDLRVAARNFYENARYYLYTIIMKYGWDAIWSDYDCFDMEFEGDKWAIWLDESIEEVANEIEKMKIQYSSLF